MPVKPDQLRDLAEMQSRNPGEAWRRSAISRAYYASYHACLEWELRLPRRGRSDASTFGLHQRLIERLKAPHRGCSAVQQASSKALGELLRTQRDRRVKSDYQLPASVKPDEMKKQLKDVRQVFRVCAS